VAAHRSMECYAGAGCDRAEVDYAGDSSNFFQRCIPMEYRRVIGHKSCFDWRSFVGRGSYTQTGPFSDDYGADARDDIFLSGEIEGSG
jgi:hypothetical protein